MELRNLTTFIEVAELNSFSKAAAHIGYSQSTVTMQIQQLEKELGVLLFERVNRTVKLTEKGHELLKYAHSIQKLTLEMKQTIKEEMNVSGLVKLATSESLSNIILRERFKAFHDHFPSISLEIRATGTNEMFDLLNHNEVDLVYTLDKHIYHAEYNMIKEEKIGMHFVAASENPITYEKNISIQDLLQYPMILTEKGMSYRKLMDEKLAAMSLQIIPLLEIGNTDLICQLILQNIGISYLPDYVTDKNIKDGRMQYLNVNDFQIDIWKQLLYHKNKWITPPIQMLIDFLCNH